MRTKNIIFALMFVSFLSYSQQDAQYTNYMYNTITINPAYAGTRDALSIFGLHRTQWVGMDGAPVTNTFSINSPIENSKLGVGLSFVNDNIGPTSSNSISADVSYTIQTSETYKLSFGIKATGDFFNLDVTKLDPKHQTDPYLQNVSLFTPNIGAGAYFYSDKLYLGYSIPNFFEATNYNSNEIAVYQERLTMYLMGGYVFDLNRNLKFKPAFLTKMVQGAPLQLDLSGTFLINDKFSLGAAWRWDAAVSFLAGFQVTEGLLIGYAYDLETTELAQYNSGSHEIFLRFELPNRQSRVASPRFF